jgi:hypothetical protein
MGEMKITAQSSKIGRMVREMYAATGMRLAIDANCPQCLWPERWFDGEQFGCNKCEYRSAERES